MSSQLIIHDSTLCDDKKHTFKKNNKKTQKYWNFFSNSWNGVILLELKTPSTSLCTQRIFTMCILPQSEEGKKKNNFTLESSFLLALSPTLSHHPFVQMMTVIMQKTSQKHEITQKYETALVVHVLKESFNFTYIKLCIYEKLLLR